MVTPPPPHNVRSVTPGNRDVLGLLLGAVAPLLLLVFLAGCSDLFTREDELLRKIDEQVRWDNAARLSITVAVPEGWGTSPQLGTGRAGDTRKGFSFTVEFNPNSAWGFSRWIAVRSDDYHEGDTDLSKALDGETVVITESTGAANARIATVTINTTEPVTLVPWCEGRPRITQSNPPLINTGVTTSRGQQIKIYFAVPLLDTAENIKFGADHIEITGQAVTSTGDLDDSIDLTGVQPEAPKYFNNPVYEASTKCITITPDPGNLPPGEMVITVTVGTALAGANGNGMLSPVSFYYRTNTLTVQKTYNADNVAAIHNPSTVSSAEDFFYWNKDKNLDRRLRKNGDGKYEVTLYFSVSRSSPEEIAQPEPGSLKIAEVEYANLGGEVGVSLIREPKDFPVITVMESDTGTAGSYYRQTNTAAEGTPFYKAVYTWDTDPAPGIIRLVALPYRSGADAVDADTWQNAMAAGRFAAVVMDDQAPSGNASLALSGEATITGGTYNYNTDKKNLKMQANFSGIADNAGYGILPIAASMDKPWTRDAPAALQWRYRIVTGSIVNHTSHPSDSGSWYALSVTSAEQDLSNLNGTALENESTVRNVQVQYKDALGNMSGWEPMANIVYYTLAFIPVTVWSANYDETANTITVTWTTPSLPVAMTGVQVSVNGGTPLDITDTGIHIITDVPRIDASGVRQGQAVSSVAGYTVTLTAYNDYGSADPTTVKIWNIPGMIASVSRNGEGQLIEDRLIEIPNGTDLTKIGNAANAATHPLSGKYVLTDDITLSGTWTPVGTNTSPFQGKFYGNEHTVTITGTMTAVDSGLFGVVGDNALVRDLTVQYGTGSAINITAPNGTRFGGIAGRMEENASFENVLVKGAANINSSGTASAFFGGLAGRMTGTSSIYNAYGGLKLNIQKTDNSSLYLGGITGCIGLPSGSTSAVGAAVRAENITVTGDIIGGSELANLLGPGATGFDGVHTGLKVGGLVGHIVGVGDGDLRAVLDNCRYREGRIEIWSSNAALNMGGAIGSVYEYATISHCSSEGDISVTRADLYRTYVGGFIGDFWSNGSIINCYSENNVTSSNTANPGNFIAYTGGFAGRLAADISYCYAKGNVTRNGLGAGYIGGFAGDFTDGASASYCYAAGNVIGDAAGDGTNPRAFFAGGFAGRLSAGSVISDSYALGNVSTTSRGSDNAGGLVGLILASSSINHCFAAGSVAVNGTSGSAIYTGGLVGNASSSPITNSAALGASVTATSSGTRNIGRVYGAGSGTNTNNYAYSGMNIFNNSTTPSDITDGAHNNQHGADEFNKFFDPQFWRNIPGIGVLGFDIAHWDFSTVWSRGYPILRGVDDAGLLGGQDTAKEWWQ
ncbi:hypothetical protein AGMMS50293_11800 [Spirochaetia bacterium]|nr:hypothetical protein AGMMS50293_11800 [Spirochaetia bacterium]